MAEHDAHAVVADASHEDGGHHDAKPLTDKSKCKACDAHKDGAEHCDHAEHCEHSHDDHHAAKGAAEHH